MGRGGGRGEEMKQINVTIRAIVTKGKRYYQAGRWVDRRWQHLEHLGTAEEVLKLVRQAKGKPHENVTL